MRTLIILLALMSLNTYANGIFIEKYSNDKVTKKEYTAFENFLNKRATESDIKVIESEADNIRFIERNGKPITLEIERLKPNSRLQRGGLRNIGNSTGRITADTGSGGGGG